MKRYKNYSYSSATVASKGDIYSRFVSCGLLFGRSSSGGGVMTAFHFFEVMLVPEIGGVGVGKGVAAVSLEKSNNSPPLEHNLLKKQ